MRYFGNCGRRPPTASTSIGEEEEEVMEEGGREDVREGGRGEETEGESEGREEEGEGEGREEEEEEGKGLVAITRHNTKESRSDKADISYYCGLKKGSFCESIELLILS
jgi:hypothetical protein